MATYHIFLFLILIRRVAFCRCDGFLLGLAMEDTNSWHVERCGLMTRQDRDSRVRMKINWVEYCRTVGISQILCCLILSPEVVALVAINRI